MTEPMKVTSMRICSTDTLKAPSFQGVSMAMTAQMVQMARATMARSSSMMRPAKCVRASFERPRPSSALRIGSRKSATMMPTQMTFTTWLSASVLQMSRF